MPRRVRVVAGLLMAATMAACSSTVPHGIGPEHSVPVAAHHATTDHAIKALPAPPQTPVTMPAGISPPTTTITYPSPYAPSYDTVASLADDATFIVIATVGPVEPGQSAEYGYPLNVGNDIGITDPKVTIGITTEEYDAAHLTVGGTYVFFWGADPVDKLVCVVGGVRGVFAYDPVTQIVTRLDHSPTSQIPRTQTLAQLSGAVDAWETAVAGQPIANIPPLCGSAATGL